MTTQHSHAGDRPRTDGGDPYRVIVNAVHHQSHVFPVRSTFNHRSFDALNRTAADIDVVSPTPFAPPVGPYSEYKHVPRTERWGTYEVHFPRFLYMLPRSQFYHVSGNSMQKRIPPYVEKTFETPHDVAHTAEIYMDGYGLLPYCRKHDIPLFVTPHGGIVNNFDDLSSAVQSKVMETFEYCSAVLSTSEELAEKTEEWVPESKIETVPIGEDPSKFPTDRKEAIRRELGIDPETPLVLFVGAFLEEKGTRELVGAIQRLDVADAHFVCVGHNGDQRWNVLKGLGESPYPGQAFWQLDPVALRRWHVAADLFVLPSYIEVRPTVIYEAMAADTAVLSTTVGGVPEMVAEGETGRLIPPRDEDALVEALEDMLSDRERLEAMGTKGGQRLVDQGWTWADHAARLNEIHRAAIDR